MKGRRGGQRCSEQVLHEEGGVRDSPQDKTDDGTTSIPRSLKRDLAAV
jgi:hypothetical protein